MGRQSRSRQVLPGKKQAIADGQPVALVAAQLWTERAETTMIGHGPRLIITLVASHPASKAEIKVLDSPGKENRIIAAKREELLAIDGKHRTSGSGQIGAVE